MYKCFDCKTAFHRRCVTKALCRREPAEGLHHHAPAGVYDDSRANPDTTTVATTTETTAETTNETTTETTTKMTNETTTKMTNETATETITDTIYKQVLEDAPAEACGDGVRENITANPDTTTTAAANTTEITIEMTNETIIMDLDYEEISEDATTTTDCLPPTRRTEITSLEYFRHVFDEVMSAEDKIRLKETIARAPRPCPVQSSFTRTDYLEMSAAWDESTFTKIRPREMFRKVHSMTVRNTSYHQLKRVRFGRDPSLKSDR